MKSLKVSALALLVTMSFASFAQATDGEVSFTKESEEFYRFILDNNEVKLKKADFSDVTVTVTTTKEKSFADMTLKEKIIRADQIQRDFAIKIVEKLFSTDSSKKCSSIRELLNHSGFLAFMASNDAMKSALDKVGIKPKTNSAADKKEAKVATAELRLALIKQKLPQAYITKHYLTKCTPENSPALFAKTEAQALADALAKIDVDADSVSLCKPIYGEYIERSNVRSGLRLGSNSRVMNPELKAKLQAEAAK